MNESTSMIQGLFQCWQRWVGSAAALVMAASCTGPIGNQGLSGETTPNVQGIYQGSYTYGGAYKKLAGQSVPFEISIRQSRGSGKISGVIKETYSGNGAMKDGFVWSDISGTCQSESGYTHLRFRKTSRHSKEPAAMYQGSLPPGSNLLTGTWYLQEKTSDSGLFQINEIHAQ